MPFGKFPSLQNDQTFLYDDINWMISVRNLQSSRLKVKALIRIRKCFHVTTPYSWSQIMCFIIVVLKVSYPNLICLLHLSVIQLLSTSSIPNYSYLFKHVPEDILLFFSIILTIFSCSLTSRLTDLVATSPTNKSFKVCVMVQQ